MMSYDHSRKIGNEGDVVKHAVLYNCVEHLAGRLAPHDAFVFADCHAGRPAYVLPVKGEWTRGVQVLSRLNQAALEPHPRIEAYRQSLIPYQIQAGQRYFGSSDVVFRSLRQIGCPFRLHLFETDPHAHDDLMRYFLPWKEVVTIRQEDGYEGVVALGAASLVLVDPPSLEDDNVMKCLGTLATHRIPFVCWTPRNSSSGGARQESERSIRFREECVVARHFPFKWSEPTGAAQNTFGCCVSVSKDLGDTAFETSISLVTLLASKGWSLE